MAVLFYKNYKNKIIIIIKNCKKKFIMVMMNNNFSTVRV